MTAANVLSGIKKLCTTIAAIGASLVAAQTAGQIALAPRVFSVISLVAIVAGLVSRSVIPEPEPPAPGPFPAAKPGSFPGAVALLLFGGLALLAPACSGINPQLKTAAFDCAAKLSAVVLGDVDAGLDTSTAALETLAVKYGVDAVTCAVSHFLADEPLPLPAPHTAAASSRVAIGRAFLAAHGGA